MTMQVICKDTSGHLQLCFVVTKTVDQKMISA